MVGVVPQTNPLRTKLTCLKNFDDQIVGFRFTK